MLTAQTGSGDRRICRTAAPVARSRTGTCGGRVCVCVVGGEKRETKIGRRGIHERTLLLFVWPWQGVLPSNWPGAARVQRQYTFVHIRTIYSMCMHDTTTIEKWRYGVHGTK